MYEYVEEGENDADTVQEALDFFHLTGFGFVPGQLAKNWKSSILLDLCDIIPPRGFGWNEHRYTRKKSSFLSQRGAGLDDHDPVNAFRPLRLLPRRNAHQPAYKRHAAGLLRHSLCVEG